MMKILILEDNKERISWFKEMFKNHELYITSDINTGFMKAFDTEYDCFFLDHDLEPDTFLGIKEHRTGYDFVVDIVNHKIQQHAIFYIHSCNPVGANKMLNLLKDNNYTAEWIPFYLLLKTKG